MNINLKDVMDIVTPVIAIAALILSIVGFFWNRQVSMLSADNNIIQYVSTLLTFLERAKKLDKEERKLFKKLLVDAKFFGPTDRDILHHLAVAEWPVDNELKEYVRSISEK